MASAWKIPLAILPWREDNRVTGVLSMIDIRAILAKSELFSGLSNASLERVEGHLSEIRFPANEVICREGAGTQFDPFMVDVMLNRIGSFEEIYHKFQDEEGER